MATTKKNASKSAPVEKGIAELRGKFEQRPTIVDVSDGPCELCAIADLRTRAASDEAGRPVSTCFRCGSADFRQGVHNDTTKWMHSNGFRSVKPSHYHLWIGQSSATGKEAFWDELCIKCYREDYMAAYPKAKKPPV